MKLYRHIVGHVEHEDLAHIRQTNQRTEQCDTRKDEQDSAQHLHAPSEDFIGRRSTDGSPQNAHWGRSTTERQQANQASSAELVPAPELVSRAQFVRSQLEGPLY